MRTKCYYLLIRYWKWIPEFIECSCSVRSRRSFSVIPSQTKELRWAFNSGKAPLANPPRLQQSLCLSLSLEDSERRGSRGRGRGGSKNTKQVKQQQGKLVESRTPLWNVVPEECLPQQYREDYGFLKSRSTPDEKKQLGHQKRRGERPTNFPSAHVTSLALACDIQYPCGLFRNQIWNNLEIYTVPLSAARSLLGLPFKSKSLACFFIEYFFMWCVIWVVAWYESSELFWFNPWRVTLGINLATTARKTNAGARERCNNKLLRRAE